MPVIEMTEPGRGRDAYALEPSTSLESGARATAREPVLGGDSPRSSM
jgi:hypothetical protein